MSETGDRLSDVRPSRTQSRRAMVATLVGTTVEYYDFALYAVSASILAKVFFSAEDSGTALLSTFMVFSIPFVLRPLGGVIFGHLGDRLGRRGVLIATVVMMGTASGLIGVLPSYAAAGVLAPVLLFLLRALQALAAGGELPGAATFAAEHAQQGRRGFYSSGVGVGVLLGTSLASGVAALVNISLSDAQMIEWGWRILFLSALPLTLAALILRLSLDDTPSFASAAAKEAVVRNPIVSVVRDHWRPLIRVALLGIGYAVGAYFSTGFMFAYMTNYLGHTSTFTSVFAGIIIALGIPCIPLFGRLSDRIGRRPVMGAAFVWYVVMTIPLVSVMGSGSTALLAVAYFAMNLPYVALLAVASTTFVELFPTEVRYSGAALGINAFALVGGATPYLATLSIEVSGNIRAPAVLIVVAAIISLLAFRTLPETSRLSLSSPSPKQRIEQ
ncbi:MFS transporter [Rhodococcoides yunnanense]|uniref:MFS transporter n=1 Tax=Rhodococcoides yunnanense TaxID=278209 RepID=UPI0009344249|nr:MFS transporter [Rhodococcus yunnanensis]